MYYSPEVPSSNRSVYEAQPLAEDSVLDESSSTFKNLKEDLKDNSADDAEDFPEPDVNTNTVDHRINTNIQRAVAFVRFKNVKFKEEDNFWTVIDENKQPFVVKLFPE